MDDTPNLFIMDLFLMEQPQAYPLSNLAISNYWH